MTPETQISRQLTWVVFSTFYSKTHGGLWGLERRIFQGNHQISLKFMQISIKTKFTPYQWMKTHGFHSTLNFVYDIDLGSLATFKYCGNVWTSVVPQGTRSIISIFLNNKLILDLQYIISWSTKQPWKNRFKGRDLQHGFYSSICWNSGPLLYCMFFATN